MYHNLKIATQIEVTPKFKKNNCRGGYYFHMYGVFWKYIFLNISWVILVRVRQIIYMADLVEGGKYMQYLVQKPQDLLCPMD